MRDAADAGSAYTWERSFRLWDTYFALIRVVTVA
ncbi:hypothetical protein FHS41_006202 [Streptomyces violarus]|uniref:Uncharacterized protein n=1 Tax=Streptomyces violarus TaxID=67380 RepID=A0A7W5F4L1_9ACTN|nr:hypothetical protein [Streptomyces violarus]